MNLRHRHLLSCFIFAIGVEGNGRRILGGTRSGVLPFHIELEVTKRNPSTEERDWSGWAGAVLLTPNGGVTTAHNLDGIISATLYFGSDVKGQGTVRRASFWKPHPEYQSLRHGPHDIGVIVWKEPLQISLTINPIRIVPPPPAGTFVWACGMGRTSTDAPQSNVLLKVNLELGDAKACLLNFGAPDGLEIDSYLCTVDKTKAEDMIYKGTCKGDSGAALYVESRPGVYQLIGITTFGQGLCEAGYDMFQSANFYQDWIMKTIRGLTPLDLQA